MRYQIYEQLRRNVVAIISLILALSNLGCNTYRNELSESDCAASGLLHDFRAV